MRVTAEEKKAQTLQGVREARRAVLAAAAAVPLEATDTVFLGEWSVKDIIAHIIGWDYANIEAVRAVLAGELPAFYAHRDRDWRTFNAGLVGRYRPEEHEAGLRAAQLSHQALCDLVESIPAGPSLSRITACVIGVTRSPLPACWRPIAKIATFTHSRFAIF